METMKFYNYKNKTRQWPIIFFLFFFSGCATGLEQQNPVPPVSRGVSLSEGATVKASVDRSIPKTLKPTASETAAFSNDPTISPNEAFFPLEAQENVPTFPRSTPSEKSAQEMLDSAMEFCNASNDFWERGDLENAIDALDQSYAIILKINPNESPELLQQIDDLRFAISQRILQVYSSRATVLNGNHKAIPLDMNSHVKKAIDMFQGSHRKSFLAAYQRSGKYRPYIVKSLKKAGLPEELSWLPLIESGFKVKALSRARALGMWQFIASTGYKYGLKRDRWVDERMDPEKSTEAAIAYLKDLHQIFGDWYTVLAAYNCGEGRVLRVINSQRMDYLDHFWDLYTRLPSETAFYVPKFVAVLQILNDPKAYGFTLPPVERAEQTEVVAIDKQVHLKSIGKQLDVSYELMQQLNPSLKHRTTPPRPFDLKIPKGKRETLLAKLGDMPDWSPPRSRRIAYTGETHTHRVRRGENLSLIAHRYGTTVGAIMRTNHLRSSRYIKAGWSLKIPTTQKYAEHQKTIVTSTATQSKSSASSATVPGHYTVRKGDSLWKIASRFGTTTKAIQAANGIPGTALSIGQVLNIPKEPVSEPGLKTASYRVLKGDSPYIIAQKHQMDLSTLLRLNQLTPRSTIFPGQTLVVKTN